MTMEIVDSTRFYLYVDMSSMLIHLRINDKRKATTINAFDRNPLHSYLTIIFAHCFVLSNVMALAFDKIIVSIVCVVRANCGILLNDCRAELA
jgi:ABC-type tungstate transport system substrate-binding protein